jgi:hypothetical protein
MSQKMSQRMSQRMSGRMSGRMSPLADDKRRYVKIEVDQIWSHY